MMDAVQVWPQLLQVAGDLVAKAQDWPGADDLAERLKKTIPQQFLDPEEQTQPDPQIQQMQMEMQTLAQENQSLKQDKELEFKKLVIDVYNAETQRIRALSDNQVDAELSQRADITAILDTGLKLHGAELAQNDQEHRQEQERAKTEMMSANPGPSQSSPMGSGVG